MKKSTVTLIICSVGGALAALIGVQIYWVATAWKLSEKEFAGKVKDVMVETSEQVNKELTCFELFSKTRIDSNEGFFIARQRWENEQFINEGPPDTIPMFFADANEHMPFEWSNLMFGSPVDVRIVLMFEYLMEDRNLAVASSNKIEKLTLQNYRDSFTESKPISERFPAEIVDSLLRKNFHAAAMNEKFRFGYVRSDLNKVSFAQNPKDSSALLRSAFSVPLTKSAYFSRPYELRLIFDNYSQVILANLGKLLAVSATVILILLVAFYLFARIILKQRRLSEMKTDFINNMTHEFKTPLTNISLALENMAAGKARDPKEERVLKIIGHEAGRLRENVDRILQVARFEKEKLHLALEHVDVHQLIQKTVSAFEPVINGSGTSIRCELNAPNPVVKADETLLFNAIYNVIDNGISYNTCKPEINISTTTRRDGVIIKIRDNGIGISTADQKKIFDNFYRVPQGNLHDVKGYGLGLSYVKLIVHAHRGQVAVNSQPGEGSEFEIFIPAA